jgi:DNA-directed RNA polymerase III subunit RPC6
MSKILRHIKSSKIFQTDLSSADVQQILDRLVFQGNVYRKSLHVGGEGAGGEEGESDDDYGSTGVYCASRVNEERECGLMQVPCGKCPVFDFCSDDGPVNPHSCEFYQEWLAF